ncbi:MAG: hypothetical protein ABJH05_01515 [Fulvivirga sp.]
MKKLSYLLSAGVLVAMLAVVGCKKDDGGGITPEDAAGANFAGTWAVSAASGAVIYDGSGGSDDRTDAYSSFALNITYAAGQGSGTYVATDGQENASPWPENGTWKFTNDTPPASADNFSIERLGDGLVVGVLISGDNMTLTFNFQDGTHTGNGRVEAVSGDWTFNLVKQ